MQHPQQLAMGNVLIISDNQFICGKIHQTIRRKSIAGYNFRFAVSPFSDPLQFCFEGQSASVYDLRNQEIVGQIIASFDLVISIHCKQIFPKDLVQNVRCVNVHPGYNPVNRGWYPQVFAIINKTPVGATIHEIDEQLDHGAIIAREFVDQFAYDTSETLYDRIVAKELELFEMYFEKIIGGKYAPLIPENDGRIHLKKDFKALLEIDLTEKATASEFINKLRALTHGTFKNAYFIDPDSGKKIYIGINLTPEDEH